MGEAALFKKLVSLAVTAVLVLSAGACTYARPLSIDRVTEGALPEDDRNVVLLNRTQWDLDVRQALTRVGFNVKRFSSTTERRVTEANGSSKFSEAEARYGITQYPGGISDWCIGRSSTKYEAYTFEVADLRTNDVVMTVQKGGWVNDCGFSKGGLFNELADTLRQNWR
jgi:hypothetical protein